MRLGRKIELRRRAPAAHFDVVHRGFSYRHAGVRDIRHHQQEMFQTLVEFGDARVVVFDGVGNFLHVREKGSGVLAGLLHARNFFAGLVAFGLQFFGGENELTALGINFAKWGEVKRHAAIARHFLDGVEVVAYVTKIEHRPSRIHERRAC